MSIPENNFLLLIANLDKLLIIPTVTLLNCFFVPDTSPTSSPRVSSIVCFNCFNKLFSGTVMMIFSVGKYFNNHAIAMDFSYVIVKTFYS